MEQNDRTAIRNLILGTLLGVILSRLTIGSLVMTVPVLLVCPKIRRTDIKILSFAAMLLGVVIWTVIQQRILIGTEYWPVIPVSLYMPVSTIIGCAVWTVGSSYSSSSMRKFFWAGIPVFVMGLALSLYFASEKSQLVRIALADGILSMFPSDSLSINLSSVVQTVVNMMALFFAPMGLVMLALPVVIADVNVNRFNEDWQYDFANMKLPDQYVWVFFGSWATALVCNLVKSIPMWAMAVCWNMALSMTVLYMVVGVSILVAFARRRTAAITAGRIVFTVVLLCFIPFVNAVVMIGLPILGVLETWIAFRSEN